LITGDIHLQSNGTTQSAKDRLKWSDKVFSDINNYCELYEIDYTIVAGDMFTSQHQLDINALSWLLKKEKELVCEMIWLIGNHDYNFRWLYSHLAWKNISVISTMKATENGLLFVPFTSHENIIRDLEVGATKKCKWLISHFPLQEGTPSEKFGNTGITISGLRLKDFNYEDYQMVFLGDFHTPHLVAGNVLYVGSPFPLSFNETLQHRMWVLDTHKGTVEEILQTGYPTFIQFENKNKEVTLIKGYDSNNYYWIKCPADQVHQYKMLYPTAKVEATTIINIERRIQSNIERLTNADYIGAYTNMVSTEMDKSELKKYGLELLK
jgi:DNA repair exonuclease SbcCD nuclease subunit